MSAAEKKEEEKLTVEEAFEKIDAVIEKLDEEDLPLEDAFTAFKEGMALVAYCEKEIDTVEKKVLKITGDGGEEAFA